MSNTYDKAYELKSALAESPEFKALNDLHQEIEADDIAKKMLENFRKLQLELQQKQMQGEQISEEEAQQAQQQFELVQQHELISKLMEAEQQLSVIITDLNKIITEPLEQIYGDPSTEEQ
ncbi:YlbF family regulator [Shouchella shacheensis]|uniref:YlbF family regulator n=1 Tax=Shouchella shacheensis TaxID=1649580 RepID=UPI0007402BDE|nr:YlbF family regulator [Shouchella shacheensis]